MGLLEVAFDLEAGLWLVTVRAQAGGVLSRTAVRVR